MSPEEKLKVYVELLNTCLDVMEGMANKINSKSRLDIHDAMNIRCNLDARARLTRRRLSELNYEEDKCQT